jgi:glutathione S-transferase
MLTIWGRTTSGNVQKVMWAIGELGLAHERIDAGGAYGGLDTPEYAAMNPNRRVPTMRDGDVVLWESNVIVRYLSARYGAGGLWPDGHAARGVADQWMDWQQTTLQPDMRTVFWGLVRTEPEKRNHADIADAVERLKELWSRLDGHLSRRPFVSGDRITMGDIPVGVMCHRYYALSVERAALRHLDAWYERLKARGAFRAQVMVPLA